MNGASSALGGRSFVVAPARARETNDGAVAREWAINGHGVVMKSIWDIGADLQAGRLQVLLPQWRTPDAPVHVFYQRTRYMAPRVRAFGLPGRTFRAGQPHAGGAPGGASVILIVQRFRATPLNRKMVTGELFRSWLLSNS
jgi:hypothetical protein